MPTVYVPGPLRFYRLSRNEPLKWPDWRYIGDSRFDDPQQQFRVLYAGSKRASFVETLAGFRPGLVHCHQTGLIPERWFSTRRIREFTTGGDEWNALDLRRSETLQVVRRELAMRFSLVGSFDFDLSYATGQNLSITQAISRWAFEIGFGGLMYTSRFGTDLTCVAIFEGSEMGEEDIHWIRRDDPDLIWAMSLLGLTDA